MKTKAKRELEPNFSSRIMSVAKRYMPVPRSSVAINGIEKEFLGLLKHGFSNFKVLSRDRSTQA
ncbi:MAG: hypothetical protein M1113_00770 [Candidatus Thermoplasmatota archaeon]|nr:hypothetical protein [Candidatus Thermoplasmatota archaeon]